MATELDSAAAPSAVPFARRARLSDEALVRLTPDSGLREYVDDLVENGLHEDALRMIAIALPKKYAVAWACECLRRASTQEAPASEVDRAALVLVRNWLASPTDDHRRAALEFAERGDFATPGCWLAAAAGWSDGSLAPRGYDAVSPPEHLSAEALVAALLLLAASDADARQERLAGYVRDALATFADAPSASPA